MHRTAPVSVFLIVGLLTLGVAVLADSLGLDPSPGWGRGRIAALAVGFLITLIPWLRRKQPGVAGKTGGSDLFAFPVLLGVIGIYLWFMGASHENASSYYALQASSFRQGELSLPLRPDPALLALPDPYDPVARQGIKAPMDLSLYNGKYYLYWGPAPSLILAAISPIFPGKINDGYLLFSFVCGIFLIQFALIMMIRDRFFPELPKWMLLLSLTGTGLIGVSSWLLVTPKIYETAIAGGQFFLIGGFFAALASLVESSPPGWKLTIAGIFLGLVVATRMVLALPVVFFTVAIACRLYQNSHGMLSKTLIRLIPLGLPLAITAVGIAWYNWARFGSISETGLYYQLAGPHLQRHYADLFSPVYFLQNAYNYLLNPFMVKPQFPYFYSIRGTAAEVLPFYDLPELYSVQAVTGLLRLVPFTLLAVIPIVAVASARFKKRITGHSEDAHNASLLNWIIISLGGISLSAFLLLQMFFWSAMRYMEDFMPALVLLAVIGFWQGYLHVSARGFANKLPVFIGVVLAGFSILAGVFISLSKVAAEYPAYWEKFLGFFHF